MSQFCQVVVMSSEKFWIHISRWFLGESLHYRTHHWCRHPCSHLARTADSFLYIPPGFW